MQSPEFLGYAKNGKAKVDSRESLDRWILSLGDCRIVLTVKKYRKKHTNQQRKYYFGVVCETARHHFGCSKNEMHGIFKLEFLVNQQYDLPTVKSTTKLTTKEYHDYIEDCCRLSAEYGCYILQPNEEYHRYVAEQYERELRHEAKSKEKASEVK